MPKVRTLREISEQMEVVMDLIDASAKQYPIKALAYELKSELTRGRAESTLRNELNGQPGYKLGLITAVQIMFKTGDLSPLDRIEALFHRVAFPLPHAVPDDLVPILGHVSKVSKEFSEFVQETATAMEDHEITLAEAHKCLGELNDLIAAAIETKSTLLHLVRQLEDES